MNSRNADDLFTEFFGSPSSSGGMGPGGMRGGGTSYSSSVFGDDIFISFGGSRPMNSAARKAPPIERTLPCSLEELYNGTTKKVKISREIAASGKTLPREEILTIDIKPGWKKGTKITFLEKGNEQPNVIPADLVFIIDEKPHSVFTREGNDLVVTEKVTVAEALAGYTAHITTLDVRRLTIPINNVINPDYEEVVPREGMPVPKDPSRRGNLRIKFKIKYPTRLTADQKSGIKRLLAP